MYLLININNQILLKIKKNFLYNIEEFQPYIIKIDENGIIKPKVYLANCIKGRNNW